MSQSVIDLPDPTELPAAPAGRGSADDLIAGLAEQQINDLLEQADQGRAPATIDGGVAPRAITDAQAKLDELDHQLARAESLGLAAVGLANEPAGLASVPAGLASAPAQLPGQAFGQPPQPPGEPIPAAAEAPPPHLEEVPVEPMAIRAADQNAAAVAVETIASEASTDSHEEPRALVDFTGHVSVEPSTGASGSQVLESSAAAVAAEIEADARCRITSPATPHQPAHASPGRWLGAVGGVLPQLPLAALNLINLPVRGLSDAHRELLAAIGIVTLVNALSILLYVMLFR